MSNISTFFVDRRFTALDGWRGICALLVAVYHFNTTSHIDRLGIVRHAYLFVDFFFVLSGFIVTYAYWQRLHTLGDACWMLSRRLARLWPLHLAMLAAFILLELAAPLVAGLLGVRRSAASLFDPTSSALLSAVPTNLMLLHGMGVHDRLTWNIPSWSISVELWTYVTFAVVAVCLRARAVLVASGLAVVGLAVIAAFSPRLIAADYDLGFMRCLYGFFIGHLTLRFMMQWSIAVPMPWVTEIAVVTGLIVFVTACAGTTSELAAPLIFAVAIWVFAQERGPVSAVLKAPPFVMMGLWSYSIYMVHSLVIAVVHRLLNVVEQVMGVELVATRGAATIVSFGGAVTMDLVVVSYCAMVVMLAALTWRFIEIPAQRYWNGRSSPPLGTGKQPINAPAVA